MADIPESAKLTDRKAKEVILDILKNKGWTLKQDAELIIAGFRNLGWKSPEEVEVRLNELTFKLGEVARQEADKIAHQTLEEVFGEEGIEIMAVWLYKRYSEILALESNWRYARKEVKARYRKHAKDVLEALKAKKLGEQKGG
jgi:hypothetical protein